MTHDTANQKWTVTEAQSKLSATYTFPTKGKYVDSDIEVNVTVSDSDLIAENIKKDTEILGITGTLDYIKTVSSVPSTKDTSVIYNSTDGKYYLWK